MNRNGDQTLSPNTQVQRSAVLKTASDGCMYRKCVPKHPEFGYGSEDYTPWHDGTVVSMWTAFLPPDKSDKFQGPGGPVGARRWPGARPKIYVYII